MSTPALSPCPFCGRTAYLEVGSRRVFCNACVVFGPDSGPPVARWNHRAPTPPDAERERLRAENERLRSAVIIALGELSGLVGVARQCEVYGPWDGSPGLDALNAALAPTPEETP